MVAKEAEVCITAQRLNSLGDQTSSSYYFFATTAKADHDRKRRLR